MFMNIINEFMNAIFIIDLSIIWREFLWQCLINNNTDVLMNNLFCLETSKLVVFRYYL